MKHGKFGILINMEYALVFALYWMYSVIITCFCSPFLLDRGCTNSEIGILMGAASVAATVLEPILGDIADRSKRFSVLEISVLLSSGLLALSVVLFFVNTRGVLMFAVYGLLLSGYTALQPLLNAMSGKLSETREEIRYGLCRSAGSLSYALMSIVMGSIVVRFGVDVLPKTGICVLFLLSLVCILMRRGYLRSLGDPENEKKTASGEDPDTDLIRFVKKNKAYVAMCVFIILLFFQNNIFNSFMLQIVENVGGDAEDMGRVFFAMAILEIPGMLLFDKLHRKIGSIALLRIAAVAFVLKVAAIFLAKNVTMMIAAHVFQTFSFAFFLPAIVQLSNEAMERNERAKSQAFYMVSVAIGQFLSSITGGILLDHKGASFMIFVTLIITALGAAGVCWFAGKIEKKGKIKSPASL